jgi:hypothetical protein
MTDCPVCGEKMWLEDSTLYSISKYFCRNCRGYCYTFKEGEK